MMKNNRGFTLIELMVAVAIVGVLAAIAYPNVTEYLMKSRRTDAKTALLGLQHAQERFRTNCSVYASTLGNARACDSGTSSYSVKYPGTSGEGWYTLSISDADGVGYVATATALAGGKQAIDTNCKKLILTFNAVNPNGLKESKNSTDLPSTGCW